MSKYRDGSQDFSAAEKAWGTKSFESSRKKRRRSVLRSCKAKEPIALADARIFRGTPSGAAQLKKFREFDSRLRKPVSRIRLL